MEARSREQPLEERLADDGGEVCVDTALDAGGTRSLEALDRGGRHALHEDAAQQLQAGGVARMRADHVDRHPERPEELGEALGAGSGRERGCRQARARHHADEGDVRELHRQRRRELPLELRRGGVQIRVERVAAELFDDAGRRSERNSRRVEAEDDIGAPDGSQIAVGVVDSVGPAGRIPATDGATRRSEIGGDPATGLAEAQHCDVHQPSTISRSPCRS